MKIFIEQPIPGHTGIYQMVVVSQAVLRSRHFFGRLRMSTKSTTVLVLNYLSLTKKVV